MARVACKIIIDGGWGRLASDLERVLLMAQEKNWLEKDVSTDLIQRMADIELAAYHGTEIPKGGLVGVMQEMVGLGLLSDEVYGIYARPGAEYENTNP